jgi:hypothetical protein
MHRQTTVKSIVQLAQQKLAGVFIACLLSDDSWHHKDFHSFVEAQASSMSEPGCPLNTGAFRSFMCNGRQRKKKVARLRSNDCYDILRFPHSCSHSLSLGCIGLYCKQKECYLRRRSRTLLFRNLNSLNKSQFDRRQKKMPPSPRHLTWISSSLGSWVWTLLQSELDSWTGFSLQFGPNCFVQLPFQLL